ncbi:MAG: DUF3038 domain-containing protein [Trichodesmium sp.]
MVISATPSKAEVFVLPQRQNYIQPPVAQKVPSDQIRTKLDMALLALKVLTGMTSDSIVQVARKLNIPSTSVDKLALVVGEDNREKSVIFRNQTPKLEEAQAFTLVICYLAKQNQELIRRAVTLVEQIAAQNSKPQSVTLLREYIFNFKKAHQNYYCNCENTRRDNPEKLALKLLVDLLFYSAPQGCNRLWSSLKS